MDDLTFLAITYEPRCRFRVSKHLEGYATIQFMERGAVWVSFDEREWTLTGAWFWPAMPGPYIRFHAPTNNGEWFHRHVGFAGPRIARWMAEGLWPTAPQPAPPGEDWPARFDELIALAKRSDRLGRKRATNRLEALLIELAEHRATRSSPSWLDELLAQLRANFAPDYARLADEVGFSPVALRRAFKDATGLTMHEYVVQERVAQARELLSETNLPLKAVALRLGYRDVYFFARQFKTLVGVSPGAFRRSRQR